MACTQREAAEEHVKTVTKSLREEESLMFDVICTLQLHVQIDINKHSVGNDLYGEIFVGICANGQMRCAFGCICQNGTSQQTNTDCMRRKILINSMKSYNYIIGTELMARERKTQIASKANKSTTNVS